ncbi:MAG: FHA domain-containing protein, partial [Deltaproteobacteria bacterium]|nr:FHA domain-containing protein [Deltaproteobacteria bacterium]
MPKLVVIKGPLIDQVFDLGSKEVVFCGRSPKMNDIAILELAVSRKHFKVFKIGKSYFVEDLNSKHGTRVNGKPIDPGEGFQINEGDLISVGNTVMQLVDSDENSPILKSIQAMKE